MLTAFRIVLVVLAVLLVFTVGCSSPTTELQLVNTEPNELRPTVEVSCIRLDETLGFKIETIESTENAVVWEVTPDNTKPVRFGLIRSEDGWEFSQQLLRLPENSKVIRASGLEMDIQLDTR